MIDAGKRFVGYHFSPLQSEQPELAQKHFIVPNLHLLGNWLKGDMDVEALNKWLNSVYPEDMHGSIEEVLSQDVSPEEVKEMDGEIERLAKKERWW